MTQVAALGAQYEENVEVIRRRFPRNCPHHILNNLVFLSYDKHHECTATPFSDETCVHGSLELSNVRTGP